MKKIIWLLTFVVILASCSPKANRYEIDGFAEGTTYHIVYLDNKESIIKPEIDSLLAVFECSCSIYDKTSLISRLNSNQTDSVDSNIEECIALAARLSEQSNGMYDITIKPLTSAMGFAADSASKSINVDSILQYIGYKKITVSGGKLIKSDPRVQIDLNSIAKGYSSDLVAQFIRSKGIKNFLVEIGGEIVCSGSSNGDAGDPAPWRVGVDKPIDNNYSPGEELQAIIELTDEALATSGNYRRFYTNEDGKRVNHTINPITGETVVNKMLSSTVVAPNCATADAYATLFMVVGIEKAKEIAAANKDLLVYFVYDADGKPASYMSPALKDMIKEE